MARTEDGEYEVVLGNKQMMTVFFIMVVLLFLFFVMGYVFGRNSAPMASTASASDASGPGARRTDAASPMPGANPAPAANAPADTAPAGGDPDAQAAPAATDQQAAPMEVPPVAANAEPVSPQPGQMFVQVSSMLEQPAAKILVEVLAKKGFRALIAPGPNEGKFRVLVGPVQDATDAGRVRSDLEQAGFKGAFVKKY